MKLRPLNDFLEDSSRIGEGFLQDILSENSFKRQVNLIVFSVLTILLSFSLIAVKDMSVAGITFSFNDSKLLVSIFCAITLYLLVIYCLSLIKDFTFFKYKIIGVIASVNELNDEHAKSVDERLDKIFSFYKEHEDIVDARNSLFEESNAIRQEYREESEKLSQKIAYQIEKGQYGDTEYTFLESENIRDKYDEKLKPYEEMIAYILEDKKTDEIVNKIQQLGSQKPEEGRTELLLSMMTRHKYIVNATVWIECIFPVLLGFSAIGISLYKLQIY